MKYVRSSIAAFALAASVALGGCSVFGALVPISGISLDKASTTIAVGSSDALHITITPSFAAVPGMAWTSSEPAIVSVTSSGLVKGLSSGSATITASAAKAGFSANCVVTVVPALYATGSVSGNIYEINIDTGTAAASPLVSTGQNATGEILYAEGRGLVAVGSYSNSAPGLYAFDPANPSAGCLLVGTKISAQYLCVASATRGFVTSVDYFSAYPNALYSFDPSNTASGLTKVVDLSYPQEVIQGGDGRIYVAENGSGKVARLDAAATVVKSEIASTVGGTTGLLAGSYKGQPGVFAANTGDYLNGSLDFIADSGSTAQAVVTGPVIGRVAALSPTLLIATGGYPSRTWAIDLTAAIPSAVEVVFGTSSFGGSDIAIVGGKAYVPDGQNTVYVFGPDFATTSIAVGKPGEMINNVGIAQ